MDGFKNAVLDELQARGYNCKEDLMIKNNDNCLHGIAITEKEDFEGMVPVVYLDNWYKEYKAGRDVKDIVEEILMGITKAEICAPEFDLDKVTWPACKNNLFPRIISLPLNAVYLMDKLYIEWGDLAIVFYTNISDNATVTVTKWMYDKWEEETGVTKTEIFETAKENLKKIFYHETLDNVLGQMMGMLYEDVPEAKEASSHMHMFTNSSDLKNLRYGAAVLLLPELINDALDEGEWIIIPSSIHEVLMFKDGPLMTSECMDMMIGDVNSKELRPEEVLSNHHYLFRSGKVLMPDGSELKLAV